VQQPQATPKVVEPQPIRHNIMMDLQSEKKIATQTTTIDNRKPAKNIIYELNPQEKFNTMASENKLLTKLKEQFDLNFDA
jgi:hypothetical protein